MGARYGRLAVVFAVLAALLVFAASGAQAIGANVVMKISKTAQDPVVNVGEDLSISVELDDAEPAAYRWYYEGEAIPGATSRVYGIDKAQVTDAGTYRVEAFDASGKMLMSMEFFVRVVDKALPKSGDGTLDISLVCGIALLSMCGMGTLLYVRKRRAA